MSEWLDELERLEREATPGPWTANPDEGGRESTEIRAQGALVANVYGVEDFPCLTDEDTESTAVELLANAQLIAAFRNEARFILGVVRAAKRCVSQGFGNYDRMLLKAALEGK